MIYHTFWWSNPYLDLLISSMNLLLLLQTGFLQTASCVYLNCCSTSSTMVCQSRHWNVPCTSSGWIWFIFMNLAVGGVVCSMFCYQNNSGKATTPIRRRKIIKPKRFQAAEFKNETFSFRDPFILPFPPDLWVQSWEYNLETKQPLTPLYCKEAIGMANMNLKNYTF